jgi:hypothetical protein
MMKAPPRIQLQYVSRIPRTVPPGKILVHNRATPHRSLGFHGFRAWLANPGARYEVCRCDWAPRIAKHYRVRRSRAPAAR